MRKYTLFSVTLACVLFTLASAKALGIEKLVTGIENQGARRNFYKRRAVEKSPLVSRGGDDDDGDDPLPAANPIQAALAPVGDILKQIGAVLSPDKPKKKKDTKEELESN